MSELRARREARPVHWVPDENGATRGESFRAVTSWRGLVMVDEQGHIVLYDSGIPRLYAQQEQATFSAVNGRRLVPIRFAVAEVAPSAFAATLTKERPAPSPNGVKRPKGTVSARVYQDRQCSYCQTVFTPTGPKSKWCDAHRKPSQRR